MVYDVNTGEIIIPRGKILNEYFVYNGKLVTKTDKTQKTPQ